MRTSTLFIALLVVVSVALLAIHTNAAQRPSSKKSAAGQTTSTASLGKYLKMMERNFDKSRKLILKEKKKRQQQKEKKSRSLSDASSLWLTKGKYTCSNLNVQDSDQCTRACIARWSNQQVHLKYWFAAFSDPPTCRICLKRVCNCCATPL